MTHDFEPEELCCCEPWRVSEHRVYTAIGVDLANRCLTELYCLADGAPRQAEIEGTRARRSSVFALDEDFAYELAWDLLDVPVPDHDDSVRCVSWVPALLEWGSDGQAWIVGADPHPLTEDLFEVLDFLGQRRVEIGALQSIAARS